MNTIFTYAGTSSLEKELLSVQLTDIQMGDVLIQGGFPGHAVIVVDLAKDKEGNKYVLLAQSYMPAQDIHILLNFQNQTLSPWYKITNDTERIETPEWTFNASDLKRFK
jgi:hypothetical protein